MRSLFFYFVIFLALTTGCRTTRNAGSTIEYTTNSENLAPMKTDYSEPSTWILGYFTKDRFLQPLHSEWFVKGYDDYEFNNAVVNSLRDIGKEGLSIKIVLGTWCPDSRREVPRFMRILDIWQFPVTGITLIGVDNIKQAPVGEYEKLDIQRVPTFIIYKNNIEAGRIIENPLTSLEQDLVNILKKE